MSGHSPEDEELPQMPRHPMSTYGARRSHAPDSAEQHRNWLSLIEVSGPFLSLPVLRSTWPTLDPLDKPARERLRLEHTTWQVDPAAGQRVWIDYVLGELLGWGNTLHSGGLDTLTMDVPEHDTQIVPSFALVEPDEDVKPRATRLLGVVCQPGAQPTARIKGEAWAATPVDRLAKLCRHHDIELGLAHRRPVVGAGVGSPRRGDHHRGIRRGRLAGDPRA
ncbi:MAG: hypothetical protein ACRDSN_20620, partial [Pseudonocardiaceae bacterium]